MASLGRVSRVERVLLAAGLTIAALITLDVVTAYVGRGRRVLEADWALLASALLLAVAAVVRPRTAARLCIVPILLTAVVVPVELVFALVVAGRDSARHSPWYVWPPNHRQAVAPRDLPGIDKPGTFSTNAAGLRGDNPPPSDAVIIRVLCVGGSTTECFYLDDSDAWPRVLQERLNAEAPAGYWVGNAGRSGLMTPDHAVLLEHLPEAANADVWLVLCGVNDMAFQLSGDYESQKVAAWNRTFAHRRPGWNGPLLRPLYRNAYLFRLLDNAVRTLRRKPSHVVQDIEAAWVGVECRRRAEGRKTDALPDLTAALEEYDRQLRRIVALARARSKRLVFLTQPTWFRENLSEELERRGWGGRLADGTYLTSAKLAEAINAYNAKLRAVCLEEHVRLVDLAAELPPTLETFYDGVHFNTLGSHRTAEIVARELTNDLAEPRR